MTRAWARSCAACSVRKGLIFLMLCSTNLQDRAVFAMCSLKVSWSSKITQRFLTEIDGVIVDEPNWIVKSCCRVGVVGKTRSSVFAKLSCRWCSFIQAWDVCNYRWIIWSKWEIELCVISVEMVGEAMCLYDGTQWCSVCGEEEGSKNRSLGNPSDQLMRFGYPPPRPPWKTDQWERIQTSEVESQWCPVMGGWTGGSDDWHFEGTANVHCYTSCTLTTLYYSKVSFIQCCHMKRYN